MFVTFHDNSFHLCKNPKICLFLMNLNVSLPSSIDVVFIVLQIYPVILGHFSSFLNCDIYLVSRVVSSFLLCYCKNCSYALFYFYGLSLTSFQDFSLIRVSSLSQTFQQKFVNSIFVFTIASLSLSVQTCLAA
jgi:hypothetical protein